VRRGLSEVLWVDGSNNGGTVLRLLVWTGGICVTTVGGDATGGCIAAVGGATTVNGDVIVCGGASLGGVVTGRGTVSVCALKAVVTGTFG
jgi:hypothetical protein